MSISSLSSLTPDSSEHNVAIMGRKSRFIEERRWHMHADSSFTAWLCRGGSALKRWENSDP